MNYRSIIFLVNLIFLISCSKKEIKTDFSVVKIDLNKKIKNVKFSSLISTNVDFIPLETNPESIIGRINKVLTTDKYIFVLDTYSTESLFMFNKEGKFIRKIGKKDVGPEDYIKPMDFILDGDVVKIIDNGFSIVSYNFDGKFMGRDKLNSFSAFNFQKISDRKFAFISGGIKDNLIITDRNFDFENSYFHFISRYVNKITVNSLSKNINGVFYKRFLNDTLYSITKSGEIIPNKFFDFGDKRFDLGKLIGDIDIDSKIKSSKFNYCITRFYFENNTHGYLLFSYKDEMWVYLQDNHQKESRLFKYDDFINDITYEYESSYIIGTEEDKMIFIVEPYNLKKVAKTMDATKNNSSKKIKEISDKLKEEDNPILMFAKFDLNEKE